MKRYFLFLLFLFVQNVNAQSVLRLQHISVEEGLSQSSVYYIFQDSHGFMWFATGDGLNRYDGKEFIPYKSKFNDTASAHLKDRNINSSILEDKNGKLWMLSDAGICFMDYRHGKSGVVKHSNGEQVCAAPAAINNDSLWATQSRFGIYAVDINSTQYKFYPFIDKWQTNVDTVCMISNGILTAEGVWVADKAGLLFFDKSKHSYERVMLNDQLNAVYLLHSGQLLLTTVDGIYVYDSGKKKSEYISIKNEISNIPLQWKSFVEDTGRHTIYLGAFNSSMICKMNLDTRKYEFINFQKSNINCLYIDRSQNLWIGTEGNGVYKLDIKRPKFFSYTPNLSNSLDEAESFMVKSIYRDDSGKTWMGTYDKGLIVCDLTTHIQRNILLPFPVNDQLISTILQDSSGNIVTTIGNKVLWLHAVSGKILQQVSLPRIISFSPQDPIIYSLTEWKKGHYLAGTNLGLYAVKNEKGIASVCQATVFKNIEKLVRWVYCLHQEKNGSVYVGQRSGFLKISMTNDTVCVLQDQGFEGVAIRHFYRSNSSPILWIATEKGLLAYNEETKHYKVFDEREGLANSFVYAILAQNDSTLWLSTNHGLSNVKVHYDHDTDIRAQFVNYSSKDGLQSNEFNSGSYFQSADGTLFFGGITGVNWFNPNQVKPNPNKAIPAIADISINDHLFATDTAIYVHSLELPFDRNTISFSLRALEYTQPEQNQFAYKLEGLDKDWVYTANDKVRYANLQPGAYTFLLKASNNEGIWNETPLEMKIIVLPPYWQTWWFRLLMVAVCVLLVFLSARIYIKQRVKAKTRELEKQQALYIERLRISKDVHDDIGSGLSKISLMADMAQKKAVGDADVSSDMQHISTVSRELVDNMRDLIWVLNPENTTLEQLVARLREYCADYLENMPLNVTLDFPDAVPAMRISREAQRNIFLTTKEAINNCIKHAAASAIKISLSFDTDKICIIIADNGKGFEMTKIKGSGNGLRNMKQRIEMIGGRFVITSVANSTTVSITIPLGQLSV